MKLKAGSICRQIVRSIFILLGFIGLPGLAPGEDLAVTITGPSEPVLVGSRTNLWLNVLNPSDREGSWVFPQKVECWVISSQGEFETALELQNPAEAGEVKFAPGAFVRREYLLSVPATATGQVVVVFPQLNANRVVLDTVAPPPETSVTGGTNESAFARIFKHVEPMEPGKPFDPGRFFQGAHLGLRTVLFHCGHEIAKRKIPDQFHVPIVE